MTQVKKLYKIQDILIPKLLSGEVRIERAEEFLEKSCNVRGGKYG